MPDRLFSRSKYTLLLGRGPGSIIVDQALKDYTFVVSKGDQVAAGYHNTVGLRSDGSVVVTGCCDWTDFGQCDVGSWENINQVAPGGRHTAALKNDGTVVAVGNNDYGQCDVDDWDLN